MDVCAALVTNHQAPEPMKPCEISLRYPSIATEPLTRLNASTRDTGGDSKFAEATDVLARAVAQISVDFARSSSRTSTLATHGHDTVNHHEKRDHVGHVRRREHGRRERQTVPIHDYMVLGALLPTICRVLAGLWAPLFAGA